MNSPIKIRRFRLWLREYRRISTFRNLGQIYNLRFNQTTKIAYLGTQVLSLTCHSRCMGGDKRGQWSNFTNTAGWLAVIKGHACNLVGI